MHHHSAQVDIQNTNYNQLIDIANHIKTVELEWHQAWGQMGELQFSAWSILIETTTFTLNMEIEEYVHAIAIYTGQAISAIYQHYSPKGFGSVWFSSLESPSQFLSAVTVSGKSSVRTT